METDYYGMTEPEVDIIQTCDAQTQTDTTPDQCVLQKLHALENHINNLTEDWRRDREKQNLLMEKQMRRMLTTQKTLMEDFFAKFKNQPETKKKNLNNAT